MVTIYYEVAGRRPQDTEDFSNMLHGYYLLEIKNHHNKRNALKLFI